MLIRDVVSARGLGGFFYDDQAAIRQGATSDGFAYVGPPLTPGFRSIRMPAASLSVGLTLEDGRTVWGDMMSVQYAGCGGRDPLFEPGSAEILLREVLAKRLVGLPAASFRKALATALAPHAGAALPAAVQYGLSQALLSAAAHSTAATAAEVICREYGCPLVARAVPLYAQSGDDRSINVDKMILKRVDVLPHGLINSPQKFGADGARFLEFVAWVVARIGQLGEQSYRPSLHFDLYGMIGAAKGLDVGAIADFIARAADLAAPFPLHVESPADFGSTQRQIEGFVALSKMLAAGGCDAKIVADEWCNTLEDIRAFAAAGAGHILQIKMPDVGSVGDSIEAVLACKEAGIGAYLGGSCVETDVSARLSVHVAVATQADMILAKPGMGVDEAVSIVGNEQSRLIALVERRRPAD